MLVSSEKTGANEVTLELKIEADVFEAAVNKAYQKDKNRINVPGFRKGKAPRAFIEKIYGKNVFYDTALDIAFPDVYDAAVKEAGIDPVDNPRDFDLKSMDENGVELTCKVTVRPDVNVVGYKGIAAVKPAVSVTDEDVEKDLQSKREAGAREISVEDRAAAMGDIATIDFEGFVDGVAFEGGKGEDYDLELGSGSFIPGFEDQVAGHNAGESFDVNVTFPEQYAEELAGKDAVFKVTVKGVKEKQLPELDDEFVKDVSEFDTLDELKDDIRKTLTQQREDSAKSAFENAVYDKLASLVTDEIPDVMVDRAVENMIDEFRYNIERQGMPFEAYLKNIGLGIDAVKGMYRARAEKDVKIELALAKIADLENVEVTDEEIAEEYDAMAKRYGVEADVVKKAIPEENVKKELRSRKASKLVIDNAVAEAEPEAPAEDAEEEKDAEEAAE
ncbi:MAG: trigger factor [Clostridia bacterium]|nr:trigger factor [Clostridia bacterium]MBR0537221.1 trigger factor [Clostridia bacterium]